MGDRYGCLSAASHHDSAAPVQEETTGGSGTWRRRDGGGPGAAATRRTSAVDSPPPEWALHHQLEESPLAAADAVATGTSGVSQTPTRAPAAAALVGDSTGPVRPEVLTVVAAAIANAEVLVGLEKALEQQLEEEEAAEEPTPPLHALLGLATSEFYDRHPVVGQTHDET